jgi:hypothetical protein
MMEGFEMSPHDKSARKIRAFGAGLAILISMGSLTACGGDPPTTTTTRQVTTDTVTPAPVPMQQTTTVQRTTTNQ